MIDQELAAACEAKGVGWKTNESLSVTKGRDYRIFDEYTEQNAWLSAEQFVRDWRVAGALMEKCAKEKSKDGRTIALSFGVEMFCATRAGSASPTYGVYLERTDESAPRAIIEACCEALS